MLGVRKTDGRVTSPYQFSVAPGGAVLGAFQRSIKRSIEEYRGVSLDLSSCTYVHYYPGDFVGAHTDRSGCEITCLVPLTGGLEGLEISPSPVGECDLDSCFSELSSSGGFLAAASPVPRVDAGRALVFDAGSFLHQRRPAEREVLLASSCFRPAS